jgi:CRISPR-associated Csx2 family protein
MIMRRVYLSFLGTNKYLSCTYFDENDRKENVRFVQEATLSLKCRDWSSDDIGYIFSTSEARKINWCDGHYTDHDTGNPVTGLEKCIQAMKLPFEVRCIDIEKGLSEEEIWKNFETVYSLFQTNDAVAFDITHAFRSIPMLAIAVLNYARVMKNVRLEGLHYGAFEVLGSYGKASSMPPEKRIVPVLDLTPLDLLMQWSLALDRFIGAGDALQLEKLASEAVTPIMKETRGSNPAARSIRSISKNLAKYTAAVATCRGKEIVPITRTIKNELEKFGRLDLIPAFQPLFKRLQRQFEPFSGDELNDGIQAARWCLKRNLVQQGYTILREIIVSHIVARVPGDEPEKDKDRRAIASSAFALKAENKPQCEWCGPAATYPEYTRKCIAMLEGHGDFVRAFNELTDYRNDLNHAGFRPNPQRASKFSENLESLLDRVDRFFRV